ncbi:MAG: Mini-ribonuclease 3 [Bacillota bacterium]
MSILWRDFQKKFEMETMSPLALAYVGDAVYELYVRLMLTSAGGQRMKELHRRAVSYVQAGAQAALLRSLESLLTEEEQEIVRRGRNAKSGHIPKNVEMLEYRLSTGLEALVGYLFLQGRQERLREILQFIVQQVEKEFQRG